MKTYPTCAQVPGFTPGRLDIENYFDEPDPYLGSLLHLKPQDPRAAAYRELW